MRTADEGTEKPQGEKKNGVKLARCDKLQTSTIRNSQGEVKTDGGFRIFQKTPCKPNENV